MIHHVRVRVPQLPIWRALLEELGWSTDCDDSDLLGMVGADGGSLWFDAGAAGLDHIAVGVASRAAVDAAAAWLVAHDLPLLCGPQERPDFGLPYYHVMARVDGLLIEVVWTGDLE